MANIAISDIETIADTLENEDLVLVSKKKTDGTFQSARMSGEKLKNATATTCQASSALTSYGTAKTSDVTSAKNAIQTSISGLNNLSSSQVQSACSTAINNATIKSKLNYEIDTTSLDKFFIGDFSVFKTLYSGKYTIINGIHGAYLPTTDAGYCRCDYKIDSSGTYTFIKMSLDYDAMVDVSISASANRVFLIVNNTYLINLYSTRHGTSFYIPKNTVFAFMQPSSDSTNVTIIPLK